MPAACGVCPRVLDEAVSIDDARAIGQSLGRRFGGDAPTCQALGDLFAALAGGAQVKIRGRQYGALVGELEFADGRVEFFDVTNNERVKTRSERDQRRGR